MRRWWLITSCAISMLAGPCASAQATWSIVAVDPDTGEVGAAIASCVNGHVDSVISAVPDRGVGVTQGVVDEPSRRRMTRALRRGQSAGASLKSARGPASDEGRSLRQFAVATLDPPAASGWTGRNTLPWSGDSSATDHSIQGNVLVSGKVLRAAERAFMHSTSRHLSDRLVAALAGGSAAGGDRRCNVAGVRQTAASAAVVVLQPGDAMFDGKRASTEAGPYLALRALDTKHRTNAVRDLMDQYEAWRIVHIDDAAPPFAAVPAGDSEARAVTRVPDRRTWIIATAVCAILCITLLVAMLQRWRRRLR